MLNIEHEKDARRFLVKNPAGDAVLEYDFPRKGTVDFTHTFVPVALRGQGIAEQLVETGLNWAKDNQLQVEASCSYVAHFLKRHTGTNQ
ncbi:MAG: N-acetyltransferase [Puniceicoccales bacterium]|jgi:predicted GNAT family acetyltransferase|nr:N-acetyltransferase [Puniceicoccales bacterium]